MKWTPWILASLVGASVVAVGLEGAAEREVKSELTSREVLVLGQICAHCHARPGDGVPQIGDAAEWARRREQGFEALVVHTIEGAGNMPPLGTCSFCSEDELRRLVAVVAGFSMDSAR